MKKVLVFLTQKFPYESGEEFVEIELSMLERSFDEVLLMPTGVRDFSRQRNVGQNTKVLTIQNTSKVVPIAIDFFKSLFKNSLLYYNELKNVNFNPRVFKYLAYHIPYALKIKNSLSRNLEMDCEYVFYSYWMDTNSFAISLLKNDFEDLNFLIRSHGGDIYNERHRCGEVLFRKSVYEKARLIAPVSINGSKYIHLHYPEFSSKVKAFKLGVLDRGCNPIETDGPFMRIVSCSSIIALKRLDKIFKVINQLGNPVEWVHFGGTPSKIIQLENLVRDSISSHVSIKLRGFVSNPELIEYYQKNHVDLFINLSTTEGVPVSIMEAISFGIPIVSNDVGGIREIVNSETGLIFKVNEEESTISGAIENLYRSGQTKDTQKREKVKSYWRANFDASQNYPEFIDILKGFSRKLN